MIDQSYNKPENNCFKCIHYRADYCKVLDMRVSPLYVCPNYEKRENVKEKK